jgi:hypothetical protein
MACSIANGMEHVEDNIAETIDEGYVAEEPVVEPPAPVAAPRPVTKPAAAKPIVKPAAAKPIVKSAAVAKPAAAKPAPRPAPEAPVAVAPPRPSKVRTRHFASEEAPTDYPFPTITLEAEPEPVPEPAGPLPEVRFEPEPEEAEPEPVRATEVVPRRVVPPPPPQVQQAAPPPRASGLTFRGPRPPGHVTPLQAVKKPSAKASAKAAPPSNKKWLVGLGLAAVAGFALLNGGGPVRGLPLSMPLQAAN